MNHTRKEPPKTAFGRKFSSHPEIVRKEVAQVRLSGPALTIQQARAIAEELKANRRIWFNPPLTQKQIENETQKIHSARYKAKAERR